MRLIFDFDGTITTHDTISYLVKESIRLQKQRTGADLTHDWKRIEKQYMEDYEAYKSTYKPIASERTNLPQELEYLSGFRKVDEKSMARVETAGIFNRISKSQFRSVGSKALKPEGELELRSGFSEIVELANKRKWHVYVLSINWSAAFIEGLLEKYPGVKVVANETTDDGRIIGPPEANGQTLSGPSDKLKALKGILGESGDRTIYFGDSTTDIKCLLHDRGIIMGAQDSSLLKTLHRIGMDVQSAKSESKTENIYWANNFHEVLDGDVLEP